MLQVGEGDTRGTGVWERKAQTRGGRETGRLGGSAGSHGGISAAAVGTRRDSLCLRSPKQPVLKLRDVPKPAEELSLYKNREIRSSIGTPACRAAEGSYLRLLGAPRPQLHSSFTIDNASFWSFLFPTVSHQ